MNLGRHALDGLFTVLFPTGVGVIRKHHKRPY